MGDDDVEKVAKQKPDLIIVLDQNKNIKNTKIAATVPFNYQKHKYLEQQEELGKLLGKEDEVKNGKNSGKIKQLKMAKKSKQNWCRFYSLNLR